MTRRILSSSNLHAANRRAPRPAIWFTVLGLLAIISLSCDFGIKPAEPVGPVGPAEPVGPAGFEKTDCNGTGITFPDITIEYIVNDYNAGPYLICNSSSTGSHGLSVHYYISVIAYQADKLDGEYQNLKASYQPFVDQATEWNADPNVPDEAKDEINFIRNDSDGYIFMITGYANVQECLNGYGYGAEKVDGKYLVNVSFQSCELADTASYTAMLQNLETTAIAAIMRLEAAKR